MIDFLASSDPWRCPFQGRTWVSGQDGQGQSFRTFFHVSQEPLCVSSKHSSARLFSSQTRTCAPTACGGDGAVSLKRLSYCDLLCCASAPACFAEAEDPAAYLKLWDFAACAHRPTMLPRWTFEAFLCCQVGAKKHLWR